MDWPPVQFPFYPKHEYGCPHVGHCPHIGCASLGTLVHAAGEQTEWMDALHRQIDALRAEGSAKFEKIKQLETRVEELEIELKPNARSSSKARRNSLPKSRLPILPHPKALRNWARLSAIQAGSENGPPPTID